MIHQNSFQFYSTTKWLHNFAAHRLILILTGAVSLSCNPSCCSPNFNEESVRHPIILSTISGFNNIYVCVGTMYAENRVEQKLHIQQCAHRTINKCAVRWCVFVYVCHALKVYSKHTHTNTHIHKATLKESTGAMRMCRERDKECVTCGDGYARNSQGPNMVKSEC